MAAIWGSIVDAENSFVAWWDEELFNAWVRRALALSTPEQQRRVEGLSFAEQRAHVRELVTSVWCAYLALNLPAPADPAYVLAFLGAANTRGETTEGEPPLGGSWVAQFGPFMYQPNMRVDVSRCSISWEGVLSTESLDVGDLQAWSQRENGGNVVSFFGARTRTDWSQGAIFNNCELRPNALGSCEEWSAHVLPPAIWEFWLWSSVAQSLADRGGYKVLLDAREWTVARNLRVMRRYDVAGIGQAAADLLAEAEVRNAETAAGGTNKEVSTILLSAGAAAQLAPPVGTVIGAVLAGVGLVLRYFGGAVGVIEDAWGRRRPEYSPFMLTGGTGTEEVPSHLVPEPAGFTRAQRGFLRVLLPNGVASARVRVDRAEWRAAIWDGPALVGAHEVEVRADARVPQLRTLRVVPNTRAEWIVTEDELPRGADVQAGRDEWRDYVDPGSPGGASTSSTSETKETAEREGALVVEGFGQVSTDGGVTWVEAPVTVSVEGVRKLRFRVNGRVVTAAPSSLGGRVKLWELVSGDASTGGASSSSDASTGGASSSSDASTGDASTGGASSSSDASTGDGRGRLRVEAAPELGTTRATLWEPLGPQWVMVHEGAVPWVVERAPGAYRVTWDAAGGGAVDVSIAASTETSITLRPRSLVERAEGAVQDAASEAAGRLADRFGAAAGVVALGVTTAVASVVIGVGRVVWRWVRRPAPPRVEAAPRQ